MPIASVLGATEASAATTDCQAQLAQLEANTAAAAGSFTNAKDLNGALNKLNAADAKLAEGKNAGAVQKLSTSRTS